MRRVHTGLKGRSVSPDDTHDPSEDQVEKRVHIRAALSRVFRALTNPEWVARWFAQVAVIEPYPGSTVEFCFHNSNGTVSVFWGEVTDHEPHRRFGFTWGHSSWGFPPTRVMFTLEATPDGTALQLIHSGFAGQPLERDIHDEGWDHYLRRLTAVADGTRPQGWI